MNYSDAVGGTVAVGKIMIYMYIEHVQTFCLIIVCFIMWRKTCSVITAQYNSSISSLGWIFNPSIAILTLESEGPDGAIKLPSITATRFINSKTVEKCCFAFAVSQSSQVCKWMEQGSHTTDKTKKIV